MTQDPPSAVLSGALTQAREYYSEASEAFGRPHSLAVV
jgi:hypothetical protein